MRLSMYSFAFVFVLILYLYLYSAYICMALERGNKERKKKPRKTTVFGGIATVAGNTQKSLHAH